MSDTLIVIDYDSAIKQLLPQDGSSANEAESTKLLVKIFQALSKLKTIKVETFFYSTDALEKIKKTIRIYAPLLASDINIICVAEDHESLKQTKGLAIGKCINQFRRFFCQPEDFNPLEQVLVLDADSLLLKSMSNIYQTYLISYIYDEKGQKLHAPYLLKLREIYLSVVRPQKEARSRQLQNITVLQVEERRDRLEENEKFLLQPWHDRILSDIESQLLQGMELTLSALQKHMSTIHMIGKLEHIHSFEEKWFNTINN